MKKHLPAFFALCVVVASLLSISGYDCFSQRILQVPAEEAAPARTTWVILFDESRFIVELDPMTEYRLALESGEKRFLCDAFSEIIFTNSGIARVRFNNGDNLTGELELDRLPVTTNWGGQAEIERDLIEAIFVIPRDEGHAHDHEHEHDHGHDHEDHDHGHSHD